MPSPALWSSMDSSVPDFPPCRRPWVGMTTLISLLIRGKPGFLKPEEITGLPEGSPRAPPPSPTPSALKGTLISPLRGWAGELCGKKGMVAFGPLIFIGSHEYAPISFPVCRSHSLLVSLCRQQLAPVPLSDGDGSGCACQADIGPAPPANQKNQQLCCIDNLSLAQLLSFYNLMLFNEIRVNLHT